MIAITNSDKDKNIDKFISYPKHVEIKFGTKVLRIIVLEAGINAIVALLPRYRIWLKLAYHHEYWLAQDMPTIMCSNTLHRYDLKSAYHMYNIVQYCTL